MRARRRPSRAVVVRTTTTTTYHQRRVVTYRYDSSESVLTAVKTSRSVIDALDTVWLPGAVPSVSAVANTTMRCTCRFEILVGRDEEGKRSILNKKSSERSNEKYSTEVNGNNSCCLSCEKYCVINNIKTVCCTLSSRRGIVNTKSRSRDQR